MYVSGWEALPDVRIGCESIQDVRECSGGPPGCPGVLRRPSQMSRSGQEALPYGRESIP